MTKKNAAKIESDTVVWTREASHAAGRLAFATERMLGASVVTISDRAAELRRAVNEYNRLMFEMHESK